MLKQATIDRIASLIKVDAAALKTAITAEAETDVTIADDIEVLDKATLATRDKNKYGEGKKAGEEMVIKNIKKEAGVDVADDDPKKVLDAIADKIKKDAGANPDARVQELEGTLTTAKNQVKKLTTELETIKSEKETLVTDTKLLSHFPANTISALTREEILSLLKTKVKIETRDGKEVVIKDGQPVLNPASLEPLPVSEAIGSYFKERSWVQDEAGAAGAAGRGTGNSAPGGAAKKFTKLSDVQKHLEAEGLNLQGEKAMAFTQAAMKDNPDMDMQS